MIWHLNRLIPPDQAEAMNLRMAQLMGGDLTAADRATVLRFPLFPNPKYPDGPSARLLWQDPTVTYSPEYLDSLLPPLDETRVNDNGHQHRVTASQDPRPEVNGNKESPYYIRRQFSGLFAKAGVHLLPGEQHYKCPWHRDQGRSLQVNKETCVWRCTGCDVGGGLKELRGHTKKTMEVSNGGNGSSGTSDPYCRTPSKIDDAPAQGILALFEAQRGMHRREWPIEDVWAVPEPLPMWRWREVMDLRERLPYALNIDPDTPPTEWSNHPPPSDWAPATLRPDNAENGSSRFTMIEHHDNCLASNRGRGKCSYNEHQVTSTWPCNDPFCERHVARELVKLRVGLKARENPGHAPLVRALGSQLTLWHFQMALPTHVVEERCRGYQRGHPSEGESATDLPSRAVR